MMRFLKNYLNKFLDITHRKIFGHKISPEMLSFLGKLSWSLFGGVIASAVIFLVNIVAGRTLGPFGFGQYTALFSVASSLSVFILFGNDSSSVRYIADKDYEARERSLFSASFWLTVFHFIILFTVFYAFNRFSGGYLSRSINFLALGIALALTLALKNLFDSYMRAFYLIKEQSLIRILSSAATIVTFSLYFFALGAKSSTNLVYAVVAGNVLFVLAALFYFYRKFSSFNFGDIKLLFHYNKYMMLGTFALTIISAEQYFIGRLIGTEALGIYSAYWYGSFVVVSHLCVYFNNIFWPAAIKNKERMPEIIGKLKRLTLVALPLWLLADVSFVALIISFFGSHYPLRFDYLVLFPLAAFACAVYLISMHLLYVDKIKLSSVVSLIVGSTLISFLYLTRNLTLYLVFQTFFYSGVSLFILRKISKDFGAKKPLEAISSERP